MSNIVRLAAFLPAVVIALSSCTNGPAYFPAPADGDAGSHRLPASTTRALSAIPSLDAARRVMGQSAEFERTLQGTSVSSDGKCENSEETVQPSTTAQGWRKDTYSAEDRRVNVDISVIVYPSEDTAVAAAETVTSDLASQCPDTLVSSFTTNFLLDGVSRTIGPDDVHRYSSTGPGIVYFSASEDTPCATVVSPASTTLIAVMACVPGPNSNKSFRTATSLLSQTVGNVYAAAG